MIEQVAHTEPGGDPAAIGLALTVASALHPPTGRAAETAPATATRRTSRAAETAPATATRRTSRAGKARRRALRG
ncbi:hypothetical protein ACGF8D_13090 [Streptomyces massasporeus]|uniref:hypothetical protein n=1 Tax=Streptomyces massasporeus TaxID=67324 RepID=UPI003723B29A